MNIFQQIDPLVIGPDFKIEVVFPDPSVDYRLDDKSLLKELEGKRSFAIAVTRVTGDLDLKSFVTHVGERF